MFYQQLATEGPMGRTVDDVARLLSTMAGWDDRAPLSLKDSLPPADAADPIACAPGKRVGWLGSIWPDLPLEPGIRELCEAALRQFEQIGCSVEPCSLAFSREQNWSTWLRLRQFLVGGKLGPLYANAATRAQMKPEAVWEVEQSHSLNAALLYQASAARTALYQALRELFTRFDYVIAPSAQVFPFDAQLHWPTLGGRRGDGHLPPLDGNRHAVHPGRAAGGQHAGGLQRQAACPWACRSPARRTAT